MFHLQDKEPGAERGVVSHWQCTGSQGELLPAPLAPPFPLQQGWRLLGTVSGAW